MLKIALQIGLCLTIVAAQAQNAKPKQFAKSIDEKDLFKHLSVISSDSLEGRETGTVGLTKAADYISGHLKDIGVQGIIDNGYLQKIDFIKQDWDTVRFKLNEVSFRHMWDYYAIPGNNPLTLVQSDSIYFGGFGIDDARYSDYQGRDYKNKILLIYDAEPRLNDSIYLFSGTKKVSEFASTEAKLKAAFKHGIKALLIIDPQFMANVTEIRRSIFSTRLTLPNKALQTTNVQSHIFLSIETTKKLLQVHQDSIVSRRDLIKNGKSYTSYAIPSSVFLKLVPKVTKIPAGNVMGYIEGSDEKLKEEVVIVSAHYDHLGKRGETDVFHGADDDGSGSVSVMEIMEAFQLAKKADKGPKRSIVGLWFCGEEKGLLGSRYYVNNPVIPLSQTVVDINIDMVGRIDSQHLDKKEYVYSIGSGKISKELYDLTEQVNKKYTELKLDYTYDDEKDPNQFYYRSDHYNFAEKGIPIVFFFNGVHPDYHRITDTIDKIDFPILAQRAKLGFYLAWEIANKEGRLK